MEQILLSADTAWFSIPIALMLFMFARNLVTGASLKTKAAQVLKRWSYQGIGI